MRLRIHYGGTFDPVHLGHMAIARAARDQLQVAVRLMPAADPPHRALPGTASKTPAPHGAGVFCVSKTRTSRRKGERWGDISSDAPLRPTSLPTL